jgi:hypothetical protein
MKTTLKLHPLTDKRKPYCLMKVIHLSDGKEHTFNSVVNSLSGDRMVWWDYVPPSIYTLKDARDIVKSIRDKSKILEEINFKH